MKKIKTNGQIDGGENISSFSCKKQLTGRLSQNVCNLSNAMELNLSLVIN